MLVRGFETAPDIEVYNESNRRAFVRYQLRPDDDIRDLIRRSRFRHIIFKPLCDSHRTDELLSLAPTGQSARALWVYRSAEARAVSAVTKFGDVNQRIIQQIADGAGGDRWQARRISSTSLALVRGVAVRASAEEAAALFWYLRNVLYFETGLAQRDEVLPVSYDALVGNPDPGMQVICRFLDYPFSSRLVAHIAPRSPRRPSLNLRPAIQEACIELEQRLDAEARRKAEPFLDAYR